jgi:hypothetical protein
MFCKFTEISAVMKSTHHLSQISSNNVFTIVVISMRQVSLKILFYVLSHAVINFLVIDLIVLFHDHVCQLVLVM